MEILLDQARIWFTTSGDAGGVVQARGVRACNESDFTIASNVSTRAGARVVSS